MNNTKVLILTKRQSWVGIRPNYGNCINQDKWYNDYPDDDNPIKKCVFNNKKETELLPVDLNDLANEEGVFLVYDSIKDTDYLKQLKEQCKGGDLYVLIHRNGDLQKDDFNDFGVKEFRVGSHTSNDYHISVFDILTDKESNKLERIIDKVFTPNLEIVLRFLHHCLVPDSEREAAELRSALLERLPNDSEAKKALDHYPERTTLEELRNQLLDFALT